MHPNDPYEAIAEDIRAAQRKLSPKYPTAEEAARRLRRARWRNACLLALLLFAIIVVLT